MTIGSQDWIDPRQPQTNADLLLSTTIPLAQFGIGPVAIGLQQGIYTHYQVQVVPTTTMNVAASIEDGNTNQTVSYQRYTAGGNSAVFYLPTSGFMGDTLSLEVNLSAAVTISAFPVAVYGLRVWPEGLRFDGLPPCQLTIWDQTSLLATGSSSFGINPSPPGRLLVGKVILNTSLAGGASNAQLQGSIQGVSKAFVNTVGAGGVIALDLQPGLLLDPGSQLKLVTSAAGTAAVMVGYDVVT
jgi:hypothetical protein